MAWLPIGLTVPQYHVAGSPASGYVLKAYKAGTSTNTALATDNTGGTTAADIVLDAEGFPAVSGSIIIPHIDQSYKLALYPTQASADADSGATWTIDNLTPVDNSGLTVGVNSQSVTYAQLASDDGKLILFTGSGGVDFDLLAAATASNGFTNIIQNSTSGTVTIDPNGSELVNGAASFVIQAGHSAIIVGTGTAWRAVDLLSRSSDITFSGDYTYTGSMTMESTDAGASSGPTFTKYRNSASPAASDVLGIDKYDGEDSGGNQTTYAEVYAEIVDPTDASEDGKLTVGTVIAGTKAARVHVGHGLYTPSATGGDQGADTINASGLYEDGNRVGAVFLDSQTASSSASMDFTTGISSTFKFYELRLHNINAATNNVTVLIRFSTDGGSTWISTGTYVNALTILDNSGTSRDYNGLTDTGAFLTSNTSSSGTLSSASDTGWSGVFRFYNPSSTSHKLVYELSGVYLGETGASDYICRVNGGGRQSGTAAVDALQVILSSGNITDGTGALYGYKY